MTTDSPETFIPAMGPRGHLALYTPLGRLVGLPRVHRELVARADIRPGHRVLEIGCGPGGLLAATTRERPDADVIGLDPDPEALAHAARRTAGRGVRLVHGTATTVPEADGSIDRVLSAFMLHHLRPQEQRDALVEVVRVLRPGGRLILADVSPTSRGPVARRIHDHGGHADVPALLTEAGLTDLAATTGRTRLGDYTVHRASRRSGAPGERASGATAP